MKATPKVAPVVHELPVAIDATEHIKATVNKKNFGDSILSP
jgi:DNA topoisomerase IB